MLYLLDMGNKNFNNNKGHNNYQKENYNKNSSKKKYPPKQRVVTTPPSPKLTVDEIIEYCKNDLGISFNLRSEDFVRNFLQKNNYFFRLKQYAETWTERTKSGKYIGLDFGHLIELSTIDMFFRKLMFKMTIDLEHFLKVKIVNDCQNNEKDDGYEVVQAFFEANPFIQRYVEDSRKLSEYTGSDFSRYAYNPAVWNLVEILKFNDFITFYSFYYEYFNKKCEFTAQFESIRRLRNGAAHNVCMLCSFTPLGWFNFDVGVSMELIGKLKTLSSGTITQLMKVPVLNDFAVMLSLYTRLATSKNVRKKTLEELEEFFDGRVLYHKDYFEGCTNIINAYKFAREVLKVYGGDD